MRKMEVIEDVHGSVDYMKVSSVDCSRKVPLNTWSISICFRPFILNFSPLYERAATIPMRAAVTTIPPRHQRKYCRAFGRCRSYYERGTAPGERKGYSQDPCGGEKTRRINP